MSTHLPRFYAVNDRPVKLVTLPDGGGDCLVFDWVTGELTSDRSYFVRLAENGVGKDLDVLTEDRFEQLVAGLRQQLSEQRQARPIAWESTGDGELPYRVGIQGHVLMIRINDFPAEPLYTLLIDDREVEDLEDWPAAWVRPAGRKDLLATGETAPATAGRVAQRQVAAERIS